MAFVLVAAPVTGYGAGVVIDPPENYSLVWSDEFDAPELDTLSWNIEVNDNGNGNGELQYYTNRRDNVAIGKEPVSGESCLVLTARKERFGDKRFTSGRVNTSGKVMFTRGIVESRIKLPRTANGLWPAFWLLGEDYWTEGWPRCGEIDILEMGNAEGIRTGSQDRFFNGACHWGFFRDGIYPNYGKSSTNAYSLQDGEFHTFTLQWDEDSIRMYLDRDKYPAVEPYYTLDVSDTTSVWSAGRYLHHDFFVLFNLAVGGMFPGISNPNDVTALDGMEAKMYVDWVRLYQKNCSRERKLFFRN